MFKKGSPENPDFTSFFGFRCALPHNDHEVVYSPGRMLLSLKGTVFA